MEQQLHLLRRRFHALAVHDQLERVEVDDELVEHQTALAALALVLGGAAQHRLDAREDLFHVKGLCDVIVRALMKPRDLVLRFALGGEHDDRHGALLPDGAQHAPAVEHGQHDVQQNEVGLYRAELRHALAAVVCQRDGIALLR